MTENEGGSILSNTILSTRRLRLRYQKKIDINFLVKLWTDKEMTKYTGGPRKRAFLIEEFNKTMIEPMQEEYDLWIIEDKETKKQVGHAGFIPKELRGKEYIELNYYIDKEYWGKGYAKEIAKGLIEYGMNTKGINEIIAIINPQNISSEKVALSIGMKLWITEERYGEMKLIYKIEK